MNARLLYIYKVRYNCHDHYISKRRSFLQKSSDLQLVTETEQDHMRLPFLQYGGWQNLLTKLSGC